MGMAFVSYRQVLIRVSKMVSETREKRGSLARRTLRQCGESWMHGPLGKQMVPASASPLSTTAFPMQNPFIYLAVLAIVYIIQQSVSSAPIFAGRFGFPGCSRRLARTAVFDPTSMKFTGVPDHGSMTAA